MVAIPPPPGTAWPATGDRTLIGFADGSFSNLFALRKTAITALVPVSTVMWQDNGDGTGQHVGTFGVAVEAYPGQQMIVANFTTQPERRTYIVNNAAAWLP